MLENQNKNFIEKLSKQKAEHDKSLQEANIEMDKMKKQIEDLKSQSNIVDRKKDHKMEELKKIVATKQVLNNDKINLLQIIKGFRKNQLSRLERK